MRSVSGLRFAVALLFAVLPHPGPAHAFAQSYPSKPLKLIVAWPPGGMADSFGRIVAQYLRERLGQKVIVENKPGAAGNIGMAAAARAAPDGYTIATGGAGNLAINPSLYRELPYDALKDFQPVSLGLLFPNVLVVHPSVPARSVQELIALAKASRVKLNYATAGVGSPPHLAAEVFASMTRIETVHVPYNGNPRAVADLLGGQVSLMFSPLAMALSHIQTGKLYALGVTSARRPRR